MAINWTQVIAQAVASAIILPVGAVSTFVVMRYFPKFWKGIEKSFAKMLGKEIADEIHRQTKSSRQDSDEAT